MNESIVERSCRYNRRLSAQRKYAKQMAVDFAVKHRLIEFEKISTGITSPKDANIRITRCFGKYFEERDAPETYTTDSGRTYIWNF